MKRENKLRFTGEWPPVIYWGEYPNWTYALDEEGVPGQDETTLKPSGQQTVIDESVAYTTGIARLASGRELPALLEIIDSEVWGVDVFINEKTSWRIFYEISSNHWKCFIQDWLPPDQRMPSVSLGDRNVFPLTITSRLPKGNNGNKYQFVIKPDGTC